jgi:hypothetical protein
VLLDGNGRKMRVGIPQEHKEIYSDVLADVESFYQSVCANSTALGGAAESNGSS